MTVFLLIIFAFILVGISAFSVPGPFGSVINSLFPIGKKNNFNLPILIGGGGGAGSQNNLDITKILDMKKLKNQVKRIMEIIMSGR